jgi:hypothetical protein
MLEDGFSKTIIDRRKSWDRCIMPGQHVFMDMCFEAKITKTNFCPVCRLEPDAGNEEAVDW